jgi:hypothetical protein
MYDISRLRVKRSGTSFILSTTQKLYFDFTEVGSEINKETLDPQSFIVV